MGGLYSEPVCELCERSLSLSCTKFTHKCSKLFILYLSFGFLSFEDLSYPSVPLVTLAVAALGKQRRPVATDYSKLFNVQFVSDTHLEDARFLNRKRKKAVGSREA